MWTTSIQAATGVAGGLVILLTLLPFLRAHQWWVRIWDFPRLQIAVVGVVVLAVWLVVGPPRLVPAAAAFGLVAVAVLYQLIRVLPYTPLAKKQAASCAAPPPADASIRILVANVFMENREAAGLLRIIDRERPDVVLTVETDPWWLEQLEPVASNLPHTSNRPLDNTYGMALFSRFPLANTTVRELSQPGVPSIRTELDLPNGRTVLLYALHPPPPFPGHETESTPRDAELVRVARELAERSLPTIVAGDLNDVAWSETTTLFQRLSGLLDPRRGRGMLNTFHAAHPFARWPLDHVFFSKDFGLVEMRRLPAFGSDHFPLVVTLALHGDAASHETPVPADDETEDRAHEILARHAAIRHPPTEGGAVA